MVTALVIIPTGRQPMLQSQQTLTVTELDIMAMLSRRTRMKHKIPMRMVLAIIQMHFPTMPRKP